MKKYMVMGRTGCGKTSLLQVLHGLEMKYQKTQMVEHFFSTVDTPGEYLERKSLLHALINTSYDTNALMLLNSVEDDDGSFPPALAGFFGCDAVGVITKIDLPEGKGDVSRMEENLREAGCKKIFKVSAATGEGIEELRKYVFEEE